MKISILVSLFYTLMFHRNVNGYNFTKLEEPTGIFIIKSFDAYIAYNHWKLYYYIELNEFYEDNVRLKECVNKIETICAKIPDNDQCQYLTYRFRRHLHSIDHSMNYIESFKKIKSSRKKRAPLGFLSTWVIKPLFGLLDEDDAEEIADKINGLSNNNEKHNVFLIDEISLIKQTIQVANLTLEGLRNNLETFNNQLEKLLNEQNINLKQHLNIEYLSSIATLIMIEHRETLNTLKETLKNTFNGEFTDLISLAQFHNDLKVVSENLEGDSTIIIGHNDDIQSIVSIRSTFLDKKLMVEITLPIVTKNPYKLTKVTTLPITLNNKTIFIDTENTEYLVSEEKAEYIPISEFELRQCKKLSGNQLVCSPQTEAFLKNEDVCESKIIFGGELNNILRKCNYKFIHNTNYIKHLEENTYYIFTKASLSIEERCLNSDPITSSLSTIGILKLNPICEIHVEGMKISPRNILHSKQQIKIESPYQFSKLSPNNLKFLETKTQDIKLPKLNFIDYDKNFRKLIDIADKREEEIKKVNKVTLMKYPEEKGFFSMYTWQIVIGLICISIILSAIRCFKSCCCY